MADPVRGCYVKGVDGNWYLAQRVYEKWGTVWKPTNLVWGKHEGAWKLAHQYDDTPPVAPVLSLFVKDTEYWDNHKQKSGRYIEVSVRMPEAKHDEDLRRIRVLTTYLNKAPGSPAGQNYIRLPAEPNSQEPWSDWHFNGFEGIGAGRDSTKWHTRKFPRNAGAQTNMPAGKQYFAAWAQDNNGNWGPGVWAEVVLPKQGVDSADRRTKETRFSPTAAGSWKQEQWKYGRLVQSSKPRSRGMFFYQNNIRKEIGAQGDPKIKEAKILITRGNDNGQPMANLWLGKHNYEAPSGIGKNLNIANILKLGVIGKGERKWFELPSQHVNLMEKEQLKGFVLNYTNDGKSPGANDYSEVLSKTEEPRIGELHVVWTEKK